MPYLYIQEFDPCLIEVLKTAYYEACCGQGAAACNVINKTVKFNSNSKKWEVDPQKIAAHILSKHDEDEQWRYMFCIYTYQHFIHIRIYTI